jgi:hypothetical protein
MPRKRRDSDEDSERGAASRRAPIYAVLARELLRHLGDTLPGVLAPGRGDRGRTLALVGASKLAPEPQPVGSVEEARAALLRGPRLVSDALDPSDDLHAELPARAAGSRDHGLHRRMVGPSGRS